jgi:DegV family protein with EDD domain
MKVRIVIDSTADIRPELKARFSIVPLTILFGEQEYVDGVDIDHHQFYEMLVESDVMPTTSQATPAAFGKVFAEAVANGESVVALAVASKLSGTYQSAVIAAADYPGKVFVVDSETAAIGTGILA